MTNELNNGVLESQWITGLGWLDSKTGSQFWDQMPQMGDSNWLEAAQVIVVEMVDDNS